MKSYYSPSQRLSNLCLINMNSWNCTFNIIEWRDPLAQPPMESTLVWPPVSIQSGHYQFVFRPSRAGEELCPGVVRAGRQVLWPHGEHVGGAGLQADAGVAALGLGLLQLQVRQRTDSHPGGQLHVRVLLPWSGDQHTHLLRRLVAPGCAQVSAVQGRVRRGVPESRRALSGEWGGASIEYVSTGCVGLRCHF